MVSSHLLLLAGIGGHAPDEALASLSTLTDTVSVVYVSAWRPPDLLRAAWQKRGLRGEFLEAADLGAAVEVAAALHERLPLDGVVTYSELLLRPQAEIAAALGLPGNSPEAVAVAQSKARQRLVFAEHGVPSPDFEVITSERDLPAAAARVGLPGVFKPSLGAGSQSVRLVSTYAELIRAFTAARAEKTPFLQYDEAYLLEERMELEADGDSGYASYCSVESLLVSGTAHHLALSDRLPLEHGYAEEGVALPSRLAPATAAAVTEAADRAIRAIGLTSGAVHTEVALTADGPKIIEVNARAGGPLPVMFKAAAGYDYAAQIGRAALGLRPSALPEFSGVALLRFLPIPQGVWRVAGQTPVEQVLRAFPELVYVSPRFAPGQRVSRQGTLHLASFLVRASDVGTARAVTRRVEQALDIRLVPGFDAPTGADRD
ncbi:acetyl-CoA carboxylase biotin carboxylase subunit family protein [Streptomyces sp. NPDC007088]|uniref:ATP-grasp domain-containing protein n=1 Tax=Streptomyces sp. NPDC007088 TaxID=3364773 RepID=UPI00369DE45A